MEITDAYLLGFNRNREYFQGEIFAKRDVLLVSVEGCIKDLGHGIDQLSPTVTEGLTNLFNRRSSDDPSDENATVSTKAAGVSNYNRMSGYDVDSDDGAGIVDDIKINGINFGKGRFLSIESTTSPNQFENKIQAAKYTMNIEFTYGLPDSSAFSFGDGDDYKGLETALQSYSSRIDVFTESFDFQGGRNGEESYVHNLDIKIRDDGQTGQSKRIEGGVCINCLPIAGQEIIADSVNIAHFIAHTIYNTINTDNHPPFPLHVSAAFKLNGAAEQMKSPHDAFFTESVNRITGACKFSKTWKHTLFISPLDNSQESEANSGGRYKFKEDDQEFSMKVAHSVTKTTTGTTVSERADIIRVGGGIQPDGRRKPIKNAYKVFEKAAEDSLTRCQSALTNILDISETLTNVILDSKVFETPQEHRMGYEITYSSDPEIVDSYAGFKLSRQLSTSRSPDGINTFVQTSTAKPIKIPTVDYGKAIQDDSINQREDRNTDHTIAKILDLISGRLLPRTNFLYNHSGSDLTVGTVQQDAGWARYFKEIGYTDNANDMRLNVIRSNTKVKPRGYKNDTDSQMTFEITSEQTFTDDQVVQNQWKADVGADYGDANYKSFFTKKEITIENVIPTKKRETYMIAGQGEVLHVAPQSDIGTVKISFSGTAIRDMSYNMLSNGAILSTDDWRKMLKEAAKDCMNYYSAPAGGGVKPKLIFVTDTTYTYNSNREFTLVITLSYTKASNIVNLEARNY